MDYAYQNLYDNSCNYLFRYVYTPQNTGCNHICGVSVKNIRKFSASPSVTVPVLFTVKRSHVPPDTKHFFIGKFHVLLQHHNGFITMPRKKGGIVIFPRFIVGALVIIHFAKIVEHTHNVRASFLLPVQFKSLCKRQKAFRNRKRMIEQCPTVSPVVVNRSRGGEEPFGNQPILEFP